MKMKTFETVKMVIDEIENSITGTREIFESDMNPENENESLLYIQLVENLSDIQAKVDALYYFLRIFIEE